MWLSWVQVELFYPANVDMPLVWPGTSLGSGKSVWEKMSNSFCYWDTSRLVIAIDTGQQESGTYWSAKVWERLSACSRNRDFKKPGSSWIQAWLFYLPFDSGSSLNIFSINVLRLPRGGFCCQKLTTHWINTVQCHLRDKFLKISAKRKFVFLIFYCASHEIIYSVLLFAYQLGSLGVEI